MLGSKISLEGSTELILVVYTDLSCAYVRHIPAGLQRVVNPPTFTLFNYK